MQQIAAQHNADKVLRLSEVCDRLGMSRTTLWRLIQNGTFPKPIKLSPRIFVWLESSLTAYIEKSAAK